MISEKRYLERLRRHLKWERQQKKAYHWRLKSMARSCAHIQDVQVFKLSQKRRKGGRHA